MKPVFQPLAITKKSVILDTDMGPDCDDVGALVTLISYAKQYGFDILGVCNCTSNRFGMGAIDAVARHCGYPIDNLGQWEHPGFMDDESCHKYTDEIAQRFSEKFANGTLAVAPSVEFYRKTLAAAPDDGVVIIVIGMLNTLSALLNSQPDEYSPLCGKDLIAKKVNALVSMAAILPEGRECNVLNDYKAAENVFTNWPTAMYLSDFHIGWQIITGYDPEKPHPENPLYESYRLYTAGRCVNSSYDLTAVQFAVLGECDLYGLLEPCRLEFYDAGVGIPDATRTVPDPDGRIRFMKKLTDDATIAASLNEHMYKYL
ncbi:MAG: nucleoside hydrolase [Clostridia bacterium]|nr:nucleoside hydrolase [Clostridia bacterium]